MKKLLVATNNPGKLREISAQLHSLDLEIISLKECGLELPKELENGNTFEENALRNGWTFF